jgi:hypothetical protein
MRGSCAPNIDELANLLKLGLEANSHLLTKAAARRPRQAKSSQSIAWSFDAIRATPTFGRREHEFWVMTAQRPDDLDESLNSFGRFGNRPNESDH